MRPMLSLLVLTGASALLLSDPARSLPSFAQQTGVPCSQCHTIAFGPALTPFGRTFKLNAYSMGDEKSMPLAAMAIASFDRTAQSQAEPPAPHFSDNDNAVIDEAAVFLGGRIAPNLGAFAQVTYSGVERNIAWDNLDIRYAHSVQTGRADVLLGVSLNNNPTLQDVWNSTPAWAFPFTGSELAPAPASSAQIEGAFAQQVLGGSVYAVVNDLVYLEAGGYRTLSDHIQENLGIQKPAEEDRIDGTAPYWRAAVQKTLGRNYASLGVFGFAPRVHPGGTSDVGEDRYDDFGYDATYQLTEPGRHTFNANATYLHERQHLAASTTLGDSDRVSNHLNTLRVNGQYAYEQTYAVSLGFFDITGSTNVARLPPQAVSGSATGSPDSRGYVIQLEWVPFGKAESYASPWLNARLGLQYTGYTRFNGAGSNYDGFGRSAHDNDTLFVFVWTAM